MLQSPERLLQRSTVSNPLANLLRSVHPIQRPFHQLPLTMASPSGVAVSEGNLLIHGASILSQLPKDLVVTPDKNGMNPHAAFLGTEFAEKNSKHTFSIGCLQEKRFVCCFRFRLWWMTQRMGRHGRDVPLETQFLLLESEGGAPPSDQTPSDCRPQTVYILFLPLLEGQFRASLQGNERDQLEVCLESGDPAVQTSEAKHSVYIHAGTNPYKVISDSFSAMEAHLQSFQCREKKKMPGMLDWFGWCTWDAFYTEVTAEGVLEGTKSFITGGTPPRFLIIDDGWQTVALDRPPTESATQGTQYASRLIHIKENPKFRKNGYRHEDPSLGLQHFMQKLKKECSFKYVYMWHAVIGYWGGVKPDVDSMEQFEAVLTYPVHSPGVLKNQPEMALDSLTVNGLGVINPKKIFEFYNELHSYLAAAGVDGVKVDSQSILETLGRGHGGRVLLTRQYQLALEESIRRNFPENGCIACMSHHTDALYSSQQTAVIRASDDFWPSDPASHTIHIASVAYNSLFLGEIMQPDWDMFQSLHPAAEFHAAARAIGGCGVYVSDKPGNHNFDLLKKLVLPDGSILRACLPGRPTRDCLFTDPARDGLSLLKIWNMNKYTGVLGVFNCQGAGWCKIDKKNIIHDQSPKVLTGKVCADDVDILSTITEVDWNGDTIFYQHRTGELVFLPKAATLPVTLNVLEYEIFTVVPLKILGGGVRFAPIGISHMFNSGGAIVSMRLVDLHKEGGKSKATTFPHGLPCLLALELDSLNVVVELQIRACGRFLAYSSHKPKTCTLQSIAKEFTYDEGTKSVALVLLPEAESQLFHLAFYF